MLPKFDWTNHAHYKMRFYRLSEQIVRGVILRPQRTEEGIAPNTIAYMKEAGSKKRPHEIWVMVTQNQNAKIKNQNYNSKLKNLEHTKILRIISAWRYPGLTKPGKPLPKEILTEINEAI